MSACGLVSLEIYIHKLASISSYLTILAKPEYSCNLELPRFLSLKLTDVVLRLVYSGNHGCYGGNMYNSFWYIVEYEGVPTESNYPYTGMVSI